MERTVKLSLVDTALAVQIAFLAINVLIVSLRFGLPKSARTKVVLAHRSMVNYVTGLPKRLIHATVGTR